ncbi:MAG: redoxin domain-containing protein [Meiothermus sp.]|uniref:redoxin domain-containing protein n=1 Tax=Meiothermus sp. TaxID=1955249 RepID=UPI0025D2C261|nr:redoxin domain-containing protein [Meiothermus sp.]MCS7194823.1 redoxin domain-containing protein [Meiothermus sp.]MDW8090355.1 redoxin domain-containing protein [Meiothermus sp.]MDW8481146.1 redoxin domain-containing protein [Meiothermus sp.]
MAVQVGDLLPDVVVYTPSVEPCRLPELAGDGPLVLLFFPAAHTRVCERELCAVRDGLATYNALGARVYGISVDTPWTLGAYAEKLGLSFPLLSDYNREATRAFGLEISLKGLPGFSQRAAYVVGPQGRVVWAWVAEVPSQEPPYEAIEEAVRAARAGASP